uniref:Uncharacterized protein n=1 Tax=Odontella aurita TaxID=265563 RepID=A0A7S4IW56_9STRA|mmetsp:Transcript_31128/g.93345  ORF Transcript_31128/g.93345 Transcript_31128/m.93345 type:complete len:119 (+) Transcript_31128:84-440(+)
MQWQRLVGGLSGAASVGAGAYGAHGLRGKDQSYVRSYETGARYHLVHSALLVATPSICGGGRTRAATAAGAFLTTGIGLFCGSCYAVGVTEDRAYGKAAPAGGVSLILGWVSLALLRK